MGKTLIGCSGRSILADYTCHGTRVPGYAGHWGQGAIERWSDYGVLEGANGLFNPDNNMTRAELAAVISRLLGLQEVAENTFSDVDENAWYAEDILKCAAAGIIQVPARAQTRTAP